MLNSADAAPRSSAVRITAGVVAAAVIAVAVNAAIALLGRATGAPAGFRPLQPGSYMSLTVPGVLAGAVGWAVVRRWSRRPAAMLRWLVPAVVAATLIPDVALLITHSEAHTTDLGVAALMVMHVATTAVAVPIFARALPLPTSASLSNLVLVTGPGPDH